MEGTRGSLPGWEQDNDMDGGAWNGSAVVLCSAGELVPFQPAALPELLKTQA